MESKSVDERTGLTKLILKNKMMKILLYCFLTVPIISCDKTNKKNYFICHNKVKYWDVIEKDFKRTGYIHGYCFYNNGTYLYYGYYNQKRFEYIVDDIEYNSHWKYLNDTSILLGDDNKKLLKLTDDSMIFIEYNSKIIKLIRSNNQKDTVGPHE